MFLQFFYRYCRRRAKVYPSLSLRGVTLRVCNPLGRMWTSPEARVQMHWSRYCAQLCWCFYDFLHPACGITYPPKRITHPKGYTARNRCINKRTVGNSRLNSRTSVNFIEKLKPPGYHSGIFLTDAKIHFPHLLTLGFFQGSKHSS